MRHAKWIINARHEVIEVRRESIREERQEVGDHYVRVWHVDGQPGWFREGQDLFDNPEDAKLRAIERVLGYALEHEVPVREQYVRTACTYAKEFRNEVGRQRDDVKGLLNRIDELRRLKKDEDPIAVSQRFQGVDDCWVVHGRNPNRQPKIAYYPTEEEAERTAAAVRQVIAEATLPLKERIKELERQLRAAKGAEQMGYAAAETERDEAREALTNLVDSSNSREHWIAARALVRKWKG